MKHLTHKSKKKSWQIKHIKKKNVIHLNYLKIKNKEKKHAKKRECKQLLKLI